MSVVDFVKLYLITDDSRSNGRQVEEVVEAAVAGGVKMVQYRPPKLINNEDIKLTAARLRRITRNAGAFLLINGRPEISIQTGADGVHLGAASIPIAVARHRHFDTGIIGYSAHSLEEAKKAESEGADFVTYSPLFPTTSSSDPRPVAGVNSLIEVAAALSIPVFPLGGINIDNVGLISAAGIRRAAVVSAITEAEDIQKAVEELLSGLMG